MKSRFRTLHVAAEPDQTGRGAAKNGQCEHVPRSQTVIHELIPPQSGVGSPQKTIYSTSTHVRQVWEEQLFLEKVEGQLALHKSFAPTTRLAVNSLTLTHSPILLVKDCSAIASSIADIHKKKRLAAPLNTP